LEQYSENQYLTQVKYFILKYYHIKNGVNTVFLDYKYCILSIELGEPP